MQQYFEKKFKIRYNFVKELTTRRKTYAKYLNDYHGNCAIYYLYIINSVSNVYQK